MRHELQRFGGREVNTAGDGFVATFTSPSAALACADEIVDAVRVLGIEVRVGVHAGEVEVRGASKSDVAGMAVHIGARVAALAGPGEVLVSSTVRDIVTGSRRSSSSAVSTNSKACRTGGGCTRWCASRPIRRRRSCQALAAGAARLAGLARLPGLTARAGCASGAAFTASAGLTA